jgi:glycosyltransferase involved in cell wall biosynthesis
MPEPNVLFIDGSNFDTFPAGGQLTTARSLMKLFGNRLALAGMTTGEEQVGQWTEKEIRGVRYLFFPAYRRAPGAGKPLVPDRLTFYASLLRYKRRILEVACPAAFVQAPEALMAVSDWGFDSVCFRFAGVANPLKGSRYRYAAPLAAWFDRRLFEALGRASVILASADEEAIRNLVLRSNGRLPRERVTQFPTCVDTSEFRPRARDEARKAVGVPENCRLFVTNGRIGRLKGWELLVDAFRHYLRQDPDAMLAFIGDGEDRPALERRIRELGLESRVWITGFQHPSSVAAWLNAADAAVFGSFVEGWSVGMLEALACGKPVVTTAVSGADAMIEPGRNGFVAQSRDPVEFAGAMAASLSLPDAPRISTGIAAQFDLPRLGERLGALWPPLLDLVNA